VTRWLLIAGVVFSSGLSTPLARAQAARPGVTDPGRAPGVSFEETARRATEAWAAGRSDEALALVRAGVALNPLWREGWWLLGLIHTEADRFAEAREALLRLVSLEPDAGPAWALLGLCEYRLQDYERALAHLWKGTTLGKFDDEALHRESQLHFALLLMRNGDFGAASKPLARVVARSHTEPRLQIPCGLFALRRPLLPEEVRPEDRDLVATAGRAGCAALALSADEARAGFEDLIARYPTARGVHLAYGLFLRREALPGALAMLQQEVRLYPDQAEVQAEIAFEILERGTPAEALVPALAAVRLSPGSGESHLALGRALAATGAIEESLVELEQAARLSPESRGVYLALAQAYASAGRTGDVERARAKLRALDAQPTPPN
jgi:predicted Zn-dependent protease